MTVSPIFALEAPPNLGEGSNLQSSVPIRTWAADPRIAKKRRIVTPPRHIYTDRLFITLRTSTLHTNETQAAEGSGGTIGRESQIPKCKKLWASGYKRKRPGKRVISLSGRGPGPAGSGAGGVRVKSVPKKAPRARFRVYQPSLFTVNGSLVFHISHTQHDTSTKLVGATTQKATREQHVVTRKFRRRPRQAGWAGQRAGPGHS